MRVRYGCYPIKVIAGEQKETEQSSLYLMHKNTVKIGEA